MNVMKLVVEGQDKVVALACGACGTVHPLSEEGRAEQCCAPYLCETCGADTGRKFWLICDSCRRAKSDAQLQKRFDEAERVPWDDAAGAMLYDEEHDRWISDPEDAEDSEPPTRYAFATLPKPLTLDADSIVENALECGEHYDDASENIGTADLKELQDFLDSWCAKVNIVSHFPDYSRVVLFDAEPAPLTP